MKKVKENPLKEQELKDLSKIYGGDSGTPIKRELLKRPKRGRYAD